MLREAFRVLKPGGRFAVSDVVVRGDVPPAIKKNMELWVGCVAGALSDYEYVAKLAKAGFDDIDIEDDARLQPRRRADVSGRRRARRRRAGAGSRRHVHQRLRPSDQASAPRPAARRAAATERAPMNSHGASPPRAFGTALLLAAVVGSGIMGERLAGGNVAIALLANTIATGATLVALILTFGPISGAHFNPAVTARRCVAGRYPVA